MFVRTIVVVRRMIITEIRLPATTLYVFTLLRQFMTSLFMVCKYVSIEASKISAKRFLFGTKSVIFVFDFYSESDQGVELPIVRFMKYLGDNIKM